MKESVARKLQGDMAVIEKIEREIADMSRSLDTYKASHCESSKWIYSGKIYNVYLMSI